MPASRKTGDAAPAAGETEAVAAVAEPETPVAVETTASAEALTAGPRPAQTLVFLGQAESAVAGVGLCKPGESYPVAAVVADRLCRGPRPLFARLAAS